MRKRGKPKISKRNRPKCGLCGSTENLTKTPCCDNWICAPDDFILSSPAYNITNCFENHMRKTLCGFHFINDHIGNWKTCRECKDSFADSIAIYANMGVNKYNFEILANPPKHAPTYCIECRKFIDIEIEAFAVDDNNYICSKCYDNIDFEDDDYDDEGFIPEEIKDFFSNRPERYELDDIEDVPEETIPQLTAIFSLISTFIDSHETGLLRLTCYDLLVSTAMHFPDDIRRGKPEGWAAGIIHVLGKINLLFDPDTEPYIESEEIYCFFGVSKSNMQTRSNKLRDMFGMFEFDPQWSTPESLLLHPVIWNINIDGKPVDLREATKKIQIKAVKDGLVPLAPYQIAEKIEEDLKVIKNFNANPSIFSDSIIEHNGKNKVKPKIIKFSDHKS